MRGGLEGSWDQGESRLTYLLPYKPMVNAGITLLSFLDLKLIFLRAPRKDFFLDFSSPLVFRPASIFVLSNSVFSWIGETYSYLYQYLRGKPVSDAVSDASDWPDLSCTVLHQSQVFIPYLKLSTRPRSNTRLFRLLPSLSPSILRSGQIFWYLSSHQQTFATVHFGFSLTVK